MSKDDQWMGTDDENVTAGGMEPPYSENILRLLNPLRRLIRQKQLIDKLHAKLDTKIQSLRQECLPLLMEDGIRRIPNEILVNIFRIGHRSTRNYSFLISVTHVCRRFRSLALQESSLWTGIKVTPRYNTDKILAFIDRSRQQDLDVTFTIGGYGLHAERADFPDAFQASSLRWTSFHTDSGSFQYIPVDLPLSRVRKLYFVNESSEYVNNIPWMLPGLQGFVGLNAIPKFCCTTPLLTECMLAFSKRFIQASEFMNCLAQLLSIENLQLVFQNTTPLDHNSMAAAPLTLMPAVQTLHVTMEVEDDVRLVKALLSRLVMANMSRLIIGCQDVKDAVTVLKPLYSRYPRVFGTPRIIGLNISSAKDVDITAIILEPLHCVCHLSIIIPHAKVITTLASYSGGNEDLREKIGSLQILRFVQCHQLLEQQVETLADNLLDNGSGRGIQLLEIFSCRSISEGFLKDMSRKLGDKISWRT
ncbi:hypothetical protein BD410DRAFT_831959 [Rickenella mellea]|uniref:F-box domain-containing protein n=1 Tax=Rickenella mellea TaxID=50990 RepID=A0A4Y7PNF7_9AGAM|nr:hypothetical protein BD410DRAFT_831959 [Rickenella mellea]